MRYILGGECRASPTVLEEWFITLMRATNMFFYPDVQSAVKRCDCVHHNALQCASLKSNFSLHEILSQADRKLCSCACHTDAEGNSVSEETWKLQQMVNL